MLKYKAAILILATLFCDAYKSVADTTSVAVEYPEVYELANIVLALTHYGRQSNGQVQQGFPYYDDMRIWFDTFAAHPLIDSVNFSKERWQEFLSFRTDAYAFAFDEQGVIKRRNKFQSFEIKTFDKYLPLVQDFAVKSNFRQFYKEHYPYYEQVKTDYRKECMVTEMIDFLNAEFGYYLVGKQYFIVLSAFVGAQNLHRDISKNETADFVPVLTELLKGKKLDSNHKSNQVHTLLTEIDHAYVNAVSREFRKQVTTKFDEGIWDDSSGYSGYGDAVFNEYMTWAVYDLFNEKYFPYADKLTLYWHYQNESRGFIYSYTFGEKLKELYKNGRAEKLTIKQLYPAMLAWCFAQPQSLSKPELVSSVDSFHTRDGRTHITLHFSEQLQPVQLFYVLVRKEKETIDTIAVNASCCDLQWFDNGTTVTFSAQLPQAPGLSLVLNWWGAPVPFKTEKEILVRSGTVVKLKGIDN
jgi:hypothetical protein